MEVEVVEANKNEIELNNDNRTGSMAMDMVLQEGFEGLSEIASVENADLGEDWVSLFFDETYLNSMATNEEVEPPVYQGTDDAIATTPAFDSSRVLSHSTMILSSSPASASSDCPSHPANFEICPDNVDAGDKFSPTSPSRVGAVTPVIQGVSPPTPARPTSSPESSLTQVSGASTSGVQPNWWGNEDQEDDGSDPPENGSEEESSTSNFDKPTHGAAPDAPLMRNTVPIQVQEVKSGAEPASSVGKIATASRSSRKRGSWERGEADNGQQQACAQSEIDIRKGGDSADGADKDEDDEKRQARLMRNRESAQLSRQRKKVYVDELEGRLRTMAATIAELNATISHLTAENVNLRRQLGFFYQPSRPGCGVPVMPYPGMISARPVYPGAQMPLVPIPRLKSQQTLTKTPKRTKSTKEPGEKKKAKKMASLATVGVMSLLCITMLLGPFGDWGPTTLRPGTTHIHVNSAQIRVGGRVLTSWNEESEKSRNITRGETWGDGGVGHMGNVKAPGSGVRNGIGGKMRSRSDRRNGNSLRRNSTAGPERLWQSCAECYSRRDEARPSQHLGEKFVATNMSEQVSLIVPRNNKLIKVDGNLIITAVMAGDKAAQDSGKPSGREGEKGRGQNNQDSTRNSFSPPTPADHQLIKAVSSQAQEGGGTVVGQKHSTNVGAFREGSGVQKPAYKSDALAPSLSSTSTFSQLVLGSLAVLKRCESRHQSSVKEIYGIPSKNQRTSCFTQTSTDGPRGPLSEPIVEYFEQWVLDAFCSGPVLNTGMCTEVFRFDTSPAEAATNSENSGEENNLTETSEEKEPPVQKKNRDPYAVPLPPIRPKDINETEPVVEKVSRKQQQRSEVPGDSTMVVSVFTGRQDIAEESRIGSGGAKGLSQIFVVVLVDNVKYITYSCMLPPTGSQAHVVAS